VPPALENVADILNWGSKNWRIFGTRFTNSGGIVDPNIAYPPPPGSGLNTFSIAYFKMVAIPTPQLVQASTNDILSSKVGERILAPQAIPGVTDISAAWNLPFFFEDSRNVFYVTTSQAMVPAPVYLDFGLSSSTASNFASDVISNLILPQIAALPASFAPSISQTSSSGADPAGIRRFVTEDAYIHAAIAATTIVSYQGVQIGPRGGVPIAQRGQP
jgi:hypothetical protein